MLFFGFLCIIIFGFLLRPIQSLQGRPTAGPMDRYLKVGPLLLHCQTNGWIFNYVENNTREQNGGESNVLCQASTGKDV